MRTRNVKFRMWIIGIALMLIFGVAFGQNENYRPLYHYYPSIDPTGLFYYAGQYYLNWGSAKSTDLVHWQMTEFGRARGNRNAPSPTPQVITGISGTAVIDWNNTSGLGKNGIPPLVAFQFTNRSTSIAYSLDTAKTWVQYENPQYCQTRQVHSATRKCSGMNLIRNGSWYCPGARSRRSDSSAPKISSTGNT